MWGPIMPLTPLGDVTLASAIRRCGSAPRSFPSVPSAASAPSAPIRCKSPPTTTCGRSAPRRLGLPPAAYLHSRRAPQDLSHANPPVLRVDHLAKSFGRKPVLADASLSLERGGCVAVVGENGSGKTTLLKIIAGFLRADAGSVLVSGSVAIARRNRWCLRH